MRPAFFLRSPCLTLIFILRLLASRPHSCWMLLVLHSHISINVHSQPGCLLHRKELCESNQQSWRHREVNLPSRNRGVLKYLRGIQDKPVWNIQEDLAQNSNWRYRSQKRIAGYPTGTRRKRVCVYHGRANSTIRCQPATLWFNSR